MDYQISSRDYLLRARSCLDEGTIQSLFYAAFELRCGIEARMQEYLEAWDHIAKKKKQGWRIADLGRNIENAFKTGNKFIRCAIHDGSTNAAIICFYYTPVSSDLRKAGGKIGNYLHSMKSFKNSKDIFWNDLRAELIDIADHLKIANTGTLLGPLLTKPGTDRVNMNIETPPGEDSELLFNKIMSPGVKIKFTLSYLNKLPDVLEKEAHLWQSTVNNGI